MAWNSTLDTRACATCEPPPPSPGGCLREAKDRDVGGTTMPVRRHRHAVVLVSGSTAGTDLGVASTHHRLGATIIHDDEVRAIDSVMREAVSEPFAALQRP